MSDHPAGEAVIGIAGGGFCGTLLAAQLVRRAQRPFRLIWWDKAGAFARGVAYGTCDKAHLLNVRAGGMGAWPEAPGDFFDWLQGESGTQALVRWQIASSLEAGDYVPRALYGDYLGQIEQDARAQAQRKTIMLEQRHSAVQGITMDAGSGQLMVQGDASLPPVRCDALVLATGNEAPRGIPFHGSAQAAAHYVHTPGWDAEDAPPGAVVRRTVLIGTGLSMVDQMLTLHRQGYSGQVTAISRHALLPQAHLPTVLAPYPQWRLTQPFAAPPTRVSALLAAIRAEIRAASRHGGDWRAVIDSLRPVTAALWNALPDGEKRRAIARLLPYWNTHRHRMAPFAHESVAQWIREGRLTLLRGRVAAITHREGEQEVEVAYHPAAGGPAALLQADRVVNCTGPQQNVAQSANPLLRALCAEGLAQPHPAGIGAAVMPDGAVEGTASARLYALGSLRVGAALESTAVPELREQAASLAQTLVARYGL